MRVRESIKKAGQFWLPTKPETKVTGILYVEDGGRARIEVVGLLHSIEDIFNGRLEQERIIGLVDGGKRVTLERCYYTKANGNLFGQMGTATISSNMVMLGIALENEDLDVNTLRFRVEGLESWIGATGIDVNSDYKTNTSKISYSAPEPIKANLDGGVTLSIGFSPILPQYTVAGHDGFEARICERHYVRLDVEKRRPLKELCDVASKLARLIGFSVDRVVSLEAVTACSDEFLKDIGNGQTAPVEISLFYPSIPYSKSIEKVNPFELTMKYDDVSAWLDVAINNWMRAYDDIAPALGAYFSVKQGNYEFLEQGLLALVQALEVLHRRTSTETMFPESEFDSLRHQLVSSCPDHAKEWIEGRLKYANEITLRRRIKSLLGPFREAIGNSKQRETLISKVTNSRNYYTHYDTELKCMAATEIELHYLSKFLESVFELHLLVLLGFDKETVQKVALSEGTIGTKLRSVLKHLEKSS